MEFGKRSAEKPKDSVPSPFDKVEALTPKAQKTLRDLWLGVQRETDKVGLLTHLANILTASEKTSHDLQDAVDVIHTINSTFSKQQRLGKEYSINNFQ